MIFFFLNFRSKLKNDVIAPELLDIIFYCVTNKFQNFNTLEIVFIFISNYLIIK